MKVLRLWPLLLLLGCGDGGSTGLSLSLPISLTGEVKSLQFWLFANPSQKNLSCATIQNQCVRTVPATPATLGGDFEGKTVARLDYVGGQGAKALALDVAPGTYLVAVEALSDTGQLLANACKTATLPGDALALQLDLYTKDSCIATAP